MATKTNKAGCVHRSFSVDPVQDKILREEAEKHYFGKYSTLVKHIFARYINDLSKIRPNQT